VKNEFIRTYKYNQLKQNNTLGWNAQFKIDEK
jgi:hypothetical protein